jgi:beta-galactosidase/beta-glucuronidase
MTTPRPEYPRPQLVRDDWLNLNGPWEFAFDFGSSGRERELEWSHQIKVPFCPESSLSGIGYKDFMPSVWYRRTFRLPKSWQGKRVLLHFGAVDYKAEVWLNGTSLGIHNGGYSSFAFELTAHLVKGDNTIVLCAEDDNRREKQPRGKQSALYHSHGCDYTRTTGIWQTVWLEAVPQTYLSELKLLPDLTNARLLIEGKLDGGGGAVTATAIFTDRVVGQDSIKTDGHFRLTIPLAELHPWFPNSPNLYDLNLSIQSQDGSEDHLQSYFGLRALSWHDGLRINGKKVFMRLVLDQGYYPDGIYTAPSDDALREDIQRAQDLGFNGARLHQKVFEPRFLYWADKLGYLVWGEHGSWGLSLDKPEALGIFLPEWVEIIARDRNHPAIIGWCPLNETRPGCSHRGHDSGFVRTVYELTKQLDPTRPVIDTSGYTHVDTDLYDVHDYDQDSVSFHNRYKGLPENAFVNCPQEEQYRGQPYWVSEYGGIWWQPDSQDQKAWGYGKRPTSEEEFLERYRALTQVLLDNPKICGFCYTQLCDVEQEVNGLYTYGREAKFNPAVIREINTKPAAYEKE